MSTLRTPQQWAGLIGSVLVAVIVGHLLAGGAFNTTQDPTSRDVLTKVANEINKTAPMMIDAETELTATSAQEGMLVYAFRLVNYSASEIVPQVMYDETLPHVTNYACSTPETRENLLNPGVTLRYSYYDRDYAFITSVDVTRAACVAAGL